jgi:hypothetical protein
MNIVVQEDIEDRFRRTVAKGFRKGNMSIALQEAMELWIKDVNQRMENNLRVSSKIRVAYRHILPNPLLNFKTTCLFASSIHYVLTCQH